MALVVKATYVGAKISENSQGIYLFQEDYGLVDPFQQHLSYPEINHDFLVQVGELLEVQYLGKNDNQP